MNEIIKKINIALIIAIALMNLAIFTSSINAELIDNGDGTVTDDDLYGGEVFMWLKSPYLGTMTWDEAMNWAENLVYAEYNDWRLPSALNFDTGEPDITLLSSNNEWGHLYYDEWDNPADQNDILPMEDYNWGHYWTKTEGSNVNSEAYAFYASFDWLCLNELKPKSNNYWVTAVRGPETPPLVRPQTVLLFDTSGSMSWSHDGEYIVPDNMQKIFFAKQAAKPFLDLLYDYYPGQTSVGIATFPEHPWEYTLDPQGQIIFPMTIIANQVTRDIFKDQIDLLYPQGNTPLLAGIRTASGMFNENQKKAIILLSNGYHNCPTTVTPFDPEVTALIDQLNAQSIRVYTIGFGRPTDIDHPLLESFAEQTGGSFYDVTGPSFDPINWDPQLALQDTYKSIFTDWFGLDSIIDPFNSISAGEKVTHEVKICEYEQMVSFYVSWHSKEEGRLNFSIISSDGKYVPTIGYGNSYHEGTTYQILTVSNEFLHRTGKVGPTTWKINIDASSLKPGQEKKYQYSVICDSQIKMIPIIRASSIGAGTKLTVSVKITGDGQPMTGLSDVTVDISRPADGLGNWLSTNEVTIAELNKIQQTVNNEQLSTYYRKSTYLIDQKGVVIPGSIQANDIPLYDDGSHGDLNSNDGVYTNTYSDTLKEGTYYFNFYSTGRTKEGNFFEREKKIDKYLGLKYSPEDSIIIIDSIINEEDIQKIRINFIPKDNLGNSFGPGYSEFININTTWSRAVSNLQDNLDGSYSQEFEIATSMASESEIKVNFGKETKTIIWDEGPKPEEKVDTETLWLVIIILIILWIMTILIAIGLIIKLMNNINRMKSQYTLKNTRKDGSRKLI